MRAPDLEASPHLSAPEFQVTAASGLVPALLGLLLGCLALALLQNLLRSLRNQARQLNFHVFWQLGIRGWHWNAQLLFNFAAVCKSQVLCDVRLKRRHDLLSGRVLANRGGDHWILHERLVDSNMGFVILLDKRADRLTGQSGHIFRHRIFWFLVFCCWYKLVCILYT